VKSFERFLEERLGTGGFSTEDALASLLPLMRQVAGAHARGLVAPLEGLNELRVEGVRIWFEEAKLAAPTLEARAVRKLTREATKSLEVVRESRRTTDVAQELSGALDLAIGVRDERPTRRVYLPGYVAWEHAIEHHDPLTDVFSLGLLLASLAGGLDLRDPVQLETFVASRGNLFALNRDLHPVLAKVIVQMTELDPHRRPQDLEALVASLENYRDQDAGFEFDIARIEGFQSRELKGKHAIVLGKLQERLFEISRRNRLLHFRQTMQTVNLTHASVPLSFDVRHIRVDQILTWSAGFKATIAAGQRVSLNKYLNFAEAVYLPSVLDRIRTEARRDQAEYGFAQLRLVLCFLRWANLKESPPAYYDSPLVLLPVELRKRKGVRDTYEIEPLAAEAEINPVLCHQLKELYDIALPELVDLGVTDLDALFDTLAVQIQASEPAVTLEKVDRPRIELIHDKARRRLDQYERRARLTGRGISQFLDLDYSYDPANYHPLGIKLFNVKVRPPATHLREIIEERPRARQYAVTPSAPETAEKEQLFYSLKESGPENPFQWEFDLCSVTLGNFKYRKMSLVRDYAELLERDTDSPAFDATFSLEPRDVTKDDTPVPPIGERFHVVPCDPTQSAAIARAQSGASYIIQGPPGTGKSQTITNLIADYVARGKRVLFVCEKRAAIDVVFARLRQLGLDELCCLIHDSQADKKAFVMDLGATYESFLDAAQPEEDGDAVRSEHLARLERELTPLAHFDAGMRAPCEQGGRALRELIERAIVLEDRRPALDALQKERLPGHAVWESARERIDRMTEALVDIQPDRVLAHHPLGLLATSLGREERPLEHITRSIEQATPLVEAIADAVRVAELPPECRQTVGDLAAAFRFVATASGLVKSGLLALLDEHASEARELARARRRRADLVREREEACEATKAWLNPLAREDLAPALEQAHQFEGRLLAFLNPGWWRLRKVMRAGYDFTTHAIAPSWSHALGLLESRYSAEDALTKFERDTVARLGYDGTLDELVQTVDTLRKQAAAARSIGALSERLLDGRRGHQTAARLLEQAGDATALEAALEGVLESYAHLSLEGLAALLADIDHSVDELGNFLDYLGELEALPDSVRAALRTLPHPPEVIEAAVADATLDACYRADRRLARFDGLARARHARRLERVYDEWRIANAHAIRERVRRRFVKHVRICGLPAAQLDPEQKEFKRHYNRGRKELEHEFGKSMRYKPIRDLVADETGRVVRDLKPVWLMSPLSVADALPLSTDEFDVVIFDEASQITLEEAVPSLFRAAQAIVVGDEMQLPPTNFFSASSSEEDDSLSFEEDGEIVEYDLAANSFLNHSAKNLPSTMLGWHYRSRSESLISFSNWAFYQGRLLTVPEGRLPRSNQAPLVATEATHGADAAAAVLDRAVSFHFMEGGVYDKRRNRREADYVAELVRELLARGEAGPSLGIVAFSEAQQDEIEGALQRLAEEDRGFAVRLEAELDREDDGQFVGLLVKNLENIQGDERDVIIMSVCYGYGPNGKMRMNFGPINKSGGEKRLNVAFSRAKSHMVVVSSIGYTDITNEYNDGANCLRNYLRYTEAASLGDPAAVESVLRDLAVLADRSDDDAGRSTVLRDRIAGALRARGYLVEASVGHSHFRCDLAIRKPGDAEHRLGILVDSPVYYAQTDLLERDMMRPRLLHDFGWNVVVVLAKDWCADPGAVIERLDRAAAGEAVDDAEDDDFEAMEEAFAVVSTQAPLAGASTSDTTAADSNGPEAADVPPIASIDDEGSVSRPDEAEAQEPASAIGDVVASLEYRRGGSSKYWEISVEGNAHTVRFGRIGTRGQSRTKEFPDSSAARRDAERLAGSKRRKGYTDLRDDR
jgi:predicted DNA-binding WGR domain protein/DNA polymerase III delta prime subunit